MNETELMEYTLKGMIGDMSTEEQERIKNMAKQIEAVIKSDPLGVMALALIGVKYQNKN